MIWFKLIGTFLLLVSGVWLSQLLNARAEAATRQAKGFLALIGTVKLRVDCFAESLPHIFSQADARILRDCGVEGEERPRDWESLLSRVPLDDAETVEAVRVFADAFGRGDREEQVRACEYTINLLEKRRLVLSEALPMEKKRNTTLCLCGALALALLLF